MVNVRCCFHSLFKKQLFKMGWGYHHCDALWDNLVDKIAVKYFGVFDLFGQNGKV